VNVKNDDFVRISEETYFFVGHLYSSMVHLRHVLDGFFEFLRTKLNLRVSNLYWSKFFGLAVQFVLRSLEIVKSVANIASFDLLTSEVLDFTCCFLDVFFTKLD